MIDIYKREIKDRQLHTVKNPDVGTWVRVTHPTAGDIERLVALIPDLDYQILEDSLDRYEMPRIEREKGFTYILIRAPVVIKEGIATAPFMFVVSSKYIITLEPSELSFLEYLVSADHDVYTTQRTKFLIRAFINMSREYAAYVESLSKKTKEKKVNLKKMRSNDILHLIESEEVLNEFITSLIPTINVMEKILSGKYFSFHKNDQELIEDLAIEYQQTLTLCRTTVRSTNNIRDAYSTIMNYNLNKVMKFLTAFTVILTLPTIIASVYGMNINLPLQQSPMAFGYIIGLVFVAMIAAFVIFYKNDWF